MTALAFVVICAVGLFATRGLAWGGNGDVLGIRFGADGDRTRVVIDLEKAAQGRVIDTGADGRVTLALNGVSPGRGLDGGGSGLVRSYQVSSSGGASRVELELARGGEIERRFLLPPGDGVAHYRYVVDIKATGAAATRSASRPPQRPTPRRAERPLVVIDAGHGGRDPGARGATVNESQVTLAAALALKAELEKTGRYRVRLTRETNTYVDLYRRVAIARQADADLFISLHADAGSDPAVRGASVYTLSEQGAGRAVREFTRTDNWRRELHLPGRDPSVDRILLDMTQRATQNRSAQFARVLLTHLEASEHPLLRRSHRDAGLAVLLAPDVPAVLLEMGFITNPDDERLLTDERARRRLMKAVADGIDRYFREPSAPVMTASTPSANS
ncbi:N-acetylmuramoyl-L-alanine amidase [Brevundimonas sp. SORGH_AS_0993]|uniref:N-acetylmuramoyl-L-alanine amidase family protein n=1 Tax=Brevundimonas sp. SORGH_AS_0993 TaxID=3041794 RepID=UPI00278A5B70|nr:N-acetylmuramoyl-L-alanine amidase [Brevundimonas sp. SORGH_AS_0993]MDQ1153871.1 N-acetylmuramoyl-L-alanine amidase [Brevundimonas sp. SORGH_AS_0993]